MELYALDASRQQIGIIDDYTSLIWAKRYAEFGDCELYIQASQRNIDLLRKGYFLVRNDDDMVCRIERIELDTDAEDGDYLIVTGYDCRRILSQRVVWSQTNFRGTVEDYIRRLITENVISPSLSIRAIDGFVLGQSAGLTDTIVQQVTYAPLDEKIIELCKAYDYGSRVTLDDNDNLAFTLYKGVDRSYDQETNDYVVFSPEFDNIISSKYVTDDTDIKNVALIAGEGQGVNRRRLVYGNAEGWSRYELYVDARDLSSETPEGETIDYDEALKARGIDALGEYGVVTSFDGEVEPNYSYKYGVDYGLGDRVQVSNQYGITSSAQITEVIETFDNDGYSVMPRFEYSEVIEHD